MAGSRYNLPIWDGLIEPKHVRRMRESVWAFLWFLDKQDITDEDPAPVSLGRPVSYEQIAEDLGISRNTARRWVTTLLTNGYISRTRTHRGYVYFVAKPKKRIRRGRASQGKTECPDVSTLKIQSAQIRYRECPDPVQRVPRSGTPNIDTTTVSPTLSSTVFKAGVVDNSPKDPAEVQDLLNQVLDVIGEDSRSPWYQILKQKVIELPSDMIYRALSQVKDDARDLLVHKSKGAYFLWLLGGRAAKEHGN